MLESCDTVCDEEIEGVDSRLVDRQRKTAKDNTRGMSCRMSGYDCRNKCVFSFCRNTVSDEADVMSTGRLFHSWHIGSVLSIIVLSRVKVREIIHLSCAQRLRSRCSHNSDTLWKAINTKSREYDGHYSITCSIIYGYPHGHV